MHRFLDQGSTTIVFVIVGIVHVMSETAVVQDPPALINTENGVLKFSSEVDIRMAIGELKSRSFNEHFATFDTLVMALANLTVENVDLKARVDVLESEIVTLESENALLKVRTTTTENSIETITKVLTLIQANARSTTDTLSPLVPRVSELQSKAAQNAKNITSVYSQFSKRTKKLEDEAFPFMPMVPNMIDNGLMNRLNGGRPAGYYTSKYRTGGVITIQAVHPYTKCFEGPYCNFPGGCPASRVSTCNDATQARPYVFGRYQKGPRAGRGGLADGWGGRSDGKILRIFGTRADTDRYDQVRVKFPTENIALTKAVLFRGYLKIIQGQASVQTDVGYRPLWNRSMTENAPQGWLQISQLVSSSHITSISNGHVLTFNAYGEKKGKFPGVGPFEMYLALPYMANVIAKEDGGPGDDTSAHWQDSIMDNLVLENLAYWAGDTIRPR